MITAHMTEINIANVIPEILEYALAMGDEVVKELAEKIAEQAEKNAPVISGTNMNTPVGPLRVRRGPDKGTRGGATGEYRGNRYANSISSGPIKGRIFVRRSKRYAYSWLACSPTWYSHFVEFGTTPHEIKVNRNYGRKKMRFPFAGAKNGLVFSKSVNHPGISGTRFMNRAADMAPTFLRTILQENGLG